MEKEEEITYNTRKKNSIKKNFLLNLINTLTTLLFPFITFPYVSRILFADGIGQVQFFQAIIDYISLFAALGIPLYAVRKVASVGDDRQERNKATIEILTLHTVLTIISYLVVILLACTVTKIQAHLGLFLLMSVALLFNTIGVPWFYQAVEDFKYITIRTIVVKLFSLVALFLLVKTQDDLLYYAGITVVANSGANIFNFFRLRRYLSWKDYSLKQLFPLRHLKPALKIFILNLIISLYISLDSIMLGFISSEQAVGYYTAATRLTKGMLGIGTALGGVLLPRFSNLIGTGRKEEFDELTKKVISLSLSFSLPIFMGLLIFSRPIILLFCGPDFEPAVSTLRYISPIIVFIGLSNIIGIQMLYPMGREKIVIMATAIGAVCNFTLNCFLIPGMAQDGAAISTVIAECLVFLSMVWIGRHHLPFTFFTRQNFHYLAGTLLMGVVAFLFLLWEINNIYILVAGIPVCICIYFIYLYLVKDPLLEQVINLILSKLKKNSHE